VSGGRVLICLQQKKNLKKHHQICPNFCRGNEFIAPTAATEAEKEKKNNSMA
jgi:hypothetical protein